MSVRGAIAKARPRFATIDEYLASVPRDQPMPYDLIARVVVALAKQYE